jgi:thymidylate synthase
MKQYLDLVKDVLGNGSWSSNRTGVRTLSIPGASMRFDLRQGFPAVTTRKLPFKTAMGELVGFLRGYRSAAQFRELGCKVWDQNANDNAQWLASPYRVGEDDLGPVYGAQWRSWPGYKLIAFSDPGHDRKVQYAVDAGWGVFGRVIGGDERGAGTLLYRAVDQVRHCLDTIVRDPSSRRILFHAWNPAALDEMALPPCHLLYQFLANPERRELSLCLYVRSNDLGLGAPFNMAEAAAILHLFGRLSGYEPRWLNYFIGDAHIYENHVDMLQEQLAREPYPMPRLRISDRIPEYAKTGAYEPEWLERVEPGDFALEDYLHHPALTAPMAV